MSGFVFDARAARAGIEIRQAAKEGATVSAVLAADEGAASQEPQKPQKPRAGRRVFIGSTWTRRPQEPQEPQINPTTIYGSINIESKIIENEDRSATSVEPAVLAVLAVLAVDEESTTQELAAASVGTAGVEAGAPVPAETVSAGPLVLTALPDETSLAGSQDTKILDLLRDERRAVVTWINDNFRSSPIGKCALCGAGSREDDPFVGVFVGDDRGISTPPVIRRGSHCKNPRR